MFGIMPAHIINISFEYFRAKLKRTQPHLSMLFVKTITNGWHTSSRMHEAICLPCIFGCNALPNNCIAPAATAGLSAAPKDETAHYLICPLMLCTITQACGLNYLPTLQQLIFGNDIDDMTGALVCAISYHVYHSLKFGKKSELQSAIESGRFDHIRAETSSITNSFLNQFDIQSNWLILRVGGKFDQHRDAAYGYQAGTLVGSPVPIASDLNHSPDQAILTVHFPGPSGPN